MQCPVEWRYVTPRHLAAGGASSLARTVAKRPVGGDDVAAELGDIREQCSFQLPGWRMEAEIDVNGYGKCHSCSRTYQEVLRICRMHTYSVGKMVRVRMS